MRLSARAVLARCFSNNCCPLGKGYFVSALAATMGQVMPRYVRWQSISS
jgi:hypothetical protein